MPSAPVRQMAADEPHDTLRRLEQRLSQASDAAERLMAEARAAGPGRPPPAGWEAPASEHRPARPTEVEALLQAIETVRDLIPPEVLERLAAAIREVLLAIRALIDVYVERLDRRRSESAEIEDIPIE